MGHAGVNTLVFCLLLTVWWPDTVLSANNVGCLFSQNVCDYEEECYDDNAFGRCQSIFDPVSEDYYKYVLDSDTVKLLEEEFERLFAGGYRWDHEYSQCVVQNILYATRHKISYDPGLCSRIMQLTIPDVPKELIPELEAAAPDELARIKFTPNRDDDDDDEVVYAAEIFTPPVNSDDREDEPESENFSALQFRKKKKFSRSEAFPGDDPDSGGGTSNRDALFRRLLEVAKDTEKLLQLQNDLDSVNPGDEEEEEMEPQIDLARMPVFSEGGVEWLPIEERKRRIPENNHVSSEEIQSGPAHFSRQFKPQKASLTYEGMKDDPAAIKLAKVYKDDKNDKLPHEMNPEMLHGNDIPDEDTLLAWHDKYKHPGFANIGRDLDVRAFEDFADANNIFKDDSHGIYFDDDTERNAPFDMDMPLFERPMREDIKKPGPTYYYHDDEDGVDSQPYGRYAEEAAKQEKENDLVKNLMNKSQRNSLNRIIWGPQVDIPESHPAREEMREDAYLDEILHVQYSSSASTEKPANDKGNKSEVDDGDSVLKRTFNREHNDQPAPTGSPRPQMMRYPLNIETSEVRSGEGHHGSFETLDSTQVYINLKQSSATEEDAKKLVKTLENLLALPRGTFSNVRLKNNRVHFKVNPNLKGLNATDVAAKAAELTKELERETKLSIGNDGIGDEVRLPVTKKEDDKVLFVVTFVLCVVVVVVLLTVAVVYVLKRHARSREKLQNISQPDNEASQDYQDLCRQRMASKTNEGAEAVHAGFSPKKMRSLSQGEGPASSSSHSSTSSWNEEPVTSNMDISTGHMILTYMEDHLKNKDRLDREWEALCAYEADPCSTAVAVLPQNMKKNRYPDVLPYDHSRVVLNELSNVSSSDYINASAITDHDPRNPAYIATQGPLPHTAADFWQMIWEQGSVVMVMLTRLMENGVAMCHRHWPEEGSDVYHIYEVHLVSEHIWCDDYIVRSFYLKNLRTGETRTVTQFHFLSWPDNGVPSSAKALLDFRRKVNKSYRGRSCPIVVHCSDGIGRTGTYILIDMVLNRMAKGAKEIDISATLEHLRDQRAGMVKTKTQFEFVLMAVAEEVHAILRALSQ